MLVFCYAKKESDDYTPVAKFPDRIMSFYLPFYSLDIKQSSESNSTESPIFRAIK